MPLQWAMLSCKHLLGLLISVGLWLFMCILPAHGQSFYTVEYVAPSGTGFLPVRYYALLNVYGDGTAVVRLRTITLGSGEDCTMELSMRDTTGLLSISDTGNTDRWLVPVGAPILIAGKRDTTMALPAFLFTKVDDFFEPTAVYCATGPAKWLLCTETVVSSFAASQLSAELVSRFYFEDEPFYQWLTQPGFRELPAHLRGARFHLIVMAHTTDATIGASSQRDLQAVVSFFQRLCNQLGLALVLYSIEGASFGKPALDAAISKLRPSGRDVVVFYYSGHGFRYTQDVPVWPRMSLRTGRDQVREQHQVDVAGIIEQLRAKGGHTTIIITDCCNENIGALSPQGREWLRTRTLGFERQHLSFANCMRLFFPEKPVMIVATSADKYQLAAGNPALGGFFSYFFQMGLTQHLYSPIRSGGWLPLLANAARQTRTQALTALCTGTVHGRCIQSPVFRLLDR